ncbi:hypothetical protein ABTZ03_29800 [Kitasatospora sp. NPDC096077]|uniref:hypothetical protein n=1 Tax=Kitasatospora sp. NPDC096077 TaxID=3155544 RepID=UPI00332BE42C
MQPVLETRARDGFDLWPVAVTEPTGFLPLGGGLPPGEVGTAVMCIAGWNAGEPDDGPDDPLGAFLHGLLTAELPYAAGGLRVVDESTGITFRPGCCDGLEDWRDWHRLVDGGGGGLLGYGHEPESALAERLGDVVRLTVDAERGDSPVIELPVTELRRLLAGAERELVDFVALAADWAARHLPPGHRAPVVGALARVLDLSAPPKR